MGVIGTLLSKMDREEYDNICNYLVGKIYPGKCTKNDKRRLREKAGSFLVTSGELFHKGQDNKVARVIGDVNVEVVPVQKQPNGFDCGAYASAFAFEWAV